MDETQQNRSGCAHGPTIHRRTRCRALVVVFGSCLLSLLLSCGMTQGSLLYFLGFGQAKTIEARFRLTKEPLLILVDDPSQRINWPQTKRYLFDDLSQSLLRNKAASKIVPLETLAYLRQTHADFYKRGCREIGRWAGAKQVLWIEIKDFRAEQNIEEALVAAYFSVTVKVIDAGDEDRLRVRLWPTAPQGHVMNVTMDGSQVSMAKTKDSIARKLAERLAEKIAKIFYDYQLGDFEREP